MEASKDSNSPWTPWTLADVKTAAWLVEKGHLTQLERIMLSSDLDTASVEQELETLRRVTSEIISVSNSEVSNCGEQKVPDGRF